MSKVKLDGAAEVAIHQLQDTKLSPMEEALFKSWATANQIKKPDSADDPIDYRGIYRLTAGKVLPYGQLAQITKQIMAQQKLKQAVRDRQAEASQTAQDRIDTMHKEERQDVTHQQKMEQGQLDLAKKPYDLQAKDKDLEAKSMDLQKQQMATEAQHVGNEGKKLDLASTLLQRSMPQPEPTVSTKSGTNQ